MELFHYLTLFRTLWLAGRFGGGKTAMSLQLAIMLVQQNYAKNIVANVQLFGFGQPEKITRTDLYGLTDTAMILDESWIMLGQGVSNKQVTEWLAYLRKSNLYMILPSVMPLSKQVSHLVCERKYSFTPLGLPLWVYRWRLTTGSMTKTDKQLGYYYWWHPSKIFQYYDHNERPGDTYYYYGNI